jgi:hypothetical protein
MSIGLLAVVKVFAEVVFIVLGAIDTLDGMSIDSLGVLA